jgi:3-hydroxyisobutyrate dehydrogenase-like beta-hydroxyacid dehydrogenase
MAKIIIIAQGAMGSGVGRRLVERGHAVTTVLEGRSPASAARAEAAGMKPIALAQAADCDLFLSILPPSEAVALARKVKPVFEQAARKPVYVDCNAVSPDTMAEVAAIVAESGASVVDAGIIGGPPKAGSTPQIYVSGPAAAVIEAIGGALDLRPLDGPVGAASAMKMCYAGLSKGFQALGAAMMGAAIKAGAGKALLAQLAESQPDFLAYLTKQVPAAFPKAYRFVGEMEEIAAFLKAGGDEGGAQIYAGMARLYERIARDVEGDKQETGALIKLVK